MGEYKITVRDEFNNELYIDAKIVKKSGEELNFDMKHLLSGWNANALGAEDNFTNAALSFNQVSQDIYQLSFNYLSFADYEHNQTAATEAKVAAKTTLVFERFSFFGTNNIDTTKLGMENNKLLNGVYQLFASDIYGNVKSFELRINNQANIEFYRRTRYEAGFSLVSAETVRAEGLNSNYAYQIVMNNAVKFILKYDNKTYQNVSEMIEAELVELTLEQHNVSFIDEYGNSFNFVAKLDRRDPNMSFADPSIFTLVDTSLITKEDVIVLCDKVDSYMTFTLNGGSSQSYTAGNVLSAEGVYVMTATDYAGNSTNTAFTIDKTVQYSVYSSVFSTEFIPPQGVVVQDGTVSFNGSGLDSKVYVVKIVKDGEEVEVSADYKFITTGSYTVTLADEVGNLAEFRFFILNSAVTSFVYTAPENYMFLNVKKIENNLSLSADYLIGMDSKGNQTITVLDNMTVSLIVAAKDLRSNNRFGFIVVVDTVNPYLTMNNVVNESSTKKDVTFADISEDSDLQIYCDGVLTFEHSYQKGDAPNVVITEKGHYKVILTDSAGNSTTYEFDRIYTVNASGLIFVALALFAVAAIIVVFLRIRKNMQVR